MFFEVQTKIGLLDIISLSRDASISSLRLCKIHRQLGEIIGREILVRQPISMKPIQHVQGRREGEFYNQDNFSILVLMRAGLFLAEGIRENFPNASFLLIDSEEDTNKYKEFLINKKIIVVDSVINTGKTMKRIVDKINRYAEEIYIATNVIQEDAIERLGMYSIIAIRKSSNSYIGKGGTDTGNRLFNTI